MIKGMVQELMLVGIAMAFIRRSAYQAAISVQIRSRQSIKRTIETWANHVYCSSEY